MNEIREGPENHKSDDICFFQNAIEIAEHVVQCRAVFQAFISPRLVNMFHLWISGTRDLEILRCLTPRLQTHFGGSRQSFRKPPFFFFW